MVKSGTLKSKTKVTSKKAAASSKKAAKQTLKTAAVSNGHSGSEEPQNTVELGLNGEHNVDEAQSETLVQTVGQPVNSQRKKAAPDAANVESIETGPAERKLKSGTLSKTKGKPMKGKGNKMEADDEDVADHTEPTAQEEADPEPASRPVTSRKRKPQEPTAEITETKQSKGKKNAAEPEPTTTTKRQKVLLNVPSSNAISGKVFVVGQNDVGQLGFNSEEVELKKRPAMLELPHSIVDVAAGGMHSVCLTESGEVITFGCNDEGALGRLTSEEEGSECIPRTVEIPEKVVQISAGDSHSAALTESGQVYIWGNFRNEDGPMGLIERHIKQMKPTKILSGITVVKIASGAEHLACLTNEGVVYTSGCAFSGQLGRVSERLCQNGGRKGLSTLLEPAAVPIARTNSRSRAILIDDIWTGSFSTFVKARDTGLIYAFGLNNYNQLGYENERVKFQPKQITSFNDKQWLQITGGQHHTLALDGDGQVHAIGRKEYGRLGLGEGSDDTSVPTVIPTLDRKKCINISCGNCISLSVSDEGSAFSWGFGTNYQLGHGTEDDCHVPRQIEGNFSKSWKAFKISGGGQHALILAQALRGM